MFILFYVEYIIHNKSVKTYFSEFGNGSSISLLPSIVDEKTFPSN